MNNPTLIAIDPASLVLPGRLLDAYYITQDPHVPLTDTLENVIRQATKTERDAVAARARFLKELGSAVEEVLARTDVEQQRKLQALTTRSSSTRTSKRK
jgi:hypothetical protein